MKITDSLRPILLPEGYSGLGADDLWNMPTTTLTAGKAIGLVRFEGKHSWFTLQSSTDETQAPFRVQPTDYDVGTNQKVWHLAGLNVAETTIYLRDGLDLAGPKTALTVWRRSTDVPAAGFAVRNLFRMDSDSNTLTDAGAFEFGWANATDAAASAFYKIYGREGGALSELLDLRFVSVGATRNAALGIGMVPERPLSIKFSATSAFAVVSVENADTTDGNGANISFRTTTTGVGGAGNTSMAGLRAVFLTHDHPTRVASMEFFIQNVSTIEVWKFRAGFTAGYGDITTASFTQLLSQRKTGWAVPTGTATRTAFDTATATTAQVAERLKALIEDLHATAGHGLIGT